MWVSVSNHLLLDSFWKDGVYSERFCRKILVHKDDLILNGLDCIELITLSCKDVIDFSNKRLDFRYEFDKAFWDEDNAEVHSLLSSLYNAGSNIVCNLGKRHCILLDLFRNETNVWLSFKSTLKSDVGSTSAHELDEVPILLCTVCISFDVADKFSESLCSGIETE